MLGGPFLSSDISGIGVLEEQAVCAVLVDTGPGLWAKVRVGDLDKVQPETEDFPRGYGVIDTKHQSWRGSQVAIVKRGQIAVTEGRGILRLFVRVPPGTAKDDAKLVATDAYTFRKIIPCTKGSLWYDNYVQRGK